MLRVKPQNFGRVVREARDEFHLTQAEMAQLLGVSPRTIQGWEAGLFIPRAENRRAILKWLEEVSE